MAHTVLMEANTHSNSSRYHTAWETIVLPIPIPRTRTDRPGIPAYWWWNNARVLSICWKDSVEQPQHWVDSVVVNPPFIKTTSIPDCLHLFSSTLTCTCKIHATCKKNMKRKKRISAHVVTLTLPPAPWRSCLSPLPSTCGSCEHNLWKQNHNNNATTFTIWARAIAIRVCGWGSQAHTHNPITHRPHRPNPPVGTTWLSGNPAVI